MTSVDKLRQLRRSSASQKQFVSVSPNLSNTYFKTVLGYLYHLSLLPFSLERGYCPTSVNLCRVWFNAYCFFFSCRYGLFCMWLLILQGISNTLMRSLLCLPHSESMGVEPVLIWAISSSEVKGIARFQMRPSNLAWAVCVLWSRGNQEAIS